MNPHSLSTLLMLILLSFSGCKDEEPAASFTVDKSTAEIGETISFSNLSENASNYFWEFGDESASADENPIHSYEATGLYTVELTAYGSDGEKDLSAETVEIVPPPLNIEPGIRAGDFFLADDLSTHFAKLDLDQMEYLNLLTTSNDYLHVFTFSGTGIEFYLNTPTEDYTLEDIPNRIEVSPPFNGWAMGGITFGSNLDDVVDVFGPNVAVTGDRIYDGIIFWADASGLLVDRIAVR